MVAACAHRLLDLPKFTGICFALTLEIVVSFKKKKTTDFTVNFVFCCRVMTVVPLCMEVYEYIFQENMTVLIVFKRFFFFC